MSRYATKQVDKDDRELCKTSMKKDVNDNTELDRSKSETYCNRDHDNNVFTDNYYD